MREISTSLEREESVVVFNAQPSSPIIGNRSAGPRITLMGGPSFVSFRRTEQKPKRETL